MQESEQNKSINLVNSLTKLIVNLFFTTLKIGTLQLLLFLIGHLLFNFEYQSFWMCALYLSICNTLIYLIKIKKWSRK